jgi:hypothetical protein
MLATPAQIGEELVMLGVKTETVEVVANGVNL